MPTIIIAPFIVSLLFGLALVWFIWFIVRNRENEKNETKLFLIPFVCVPVTTGMYVWQLENSNLTAAFFLASSVLAVCLIIMMKRSLTHLHPWSYFGLLIVFIYMTIYAVIRAKRPEFQVAAVLSQLLMLMGFVLTRIRKNVGMCSLFELCVMMSGSIGFNAFCFIKV